MKTWPGRHCRIRIGKKNQATRRHTKTVGSEIEARTKAAMLASQEEVLKETVCWFRSEANAYTVAWNTREGKRR